VIVVRTTVTAKADQQQEMVELFKSMRNSLPNPDRMRIYVAYPFGAPLFQVETEMEYESLASLEQEIGEFFANSETVEIWKKWRTLIEPGGDTTIWTLVE
jgi:hypothetical protein